MTYFIRNGNTYRITDEANVDIKQHLPTANYIVGQDSFGNFYLEVIDNFKPLSKYYGDCISNTKRILNTFADRENSTGVVLNGEKGSGKTLLAKNICIEAAKNNIPTIVINRDWCGDAFNSLIQSIDQPCVILFDEFEKVYNSDSQEQILTLLDGVFPSKKLFIITCNDKWRIDRHMRNRPGRIFYMIDFKGLGPDFIREYCNDNLNAKEHIDTIVRIASLFFEFNFDMLKALVEDMNRYNESPQEAIKLLNAKPEYDAGNGTVMYDVTLELKGNRVPRDQMVTSSWRANPISQNEFSIGYYSEDGEDEFSSVFKSTDLRTFDGDQGIFVFKNEKGEQVTFTKAKNERFDYMSFLV